MPISKKGLTILSFDEAIKENFDDLKSKYKKFFPEKPLSKIEDDSYSDLNDDYTSYSMEYFYKYPSDHAEIPFLLSHNFANAAIARMKNGYPDQAWFLLSKARYFAGIADASLFGTKRFLDEIVNAHAIKGTKSRSNKISLTKIEAARLIRETADNLSTDQKGKWIGWKSRTEAAEAIADGMRNFVKGNAIGLETEGIPRRAAEWMREDEDIRNAFNETCAKDAEYTPKKHRNWDDNWKSVE